MSKIKKLGLGIIAFEGTEHIKNITYAVRDLCDTIVVCLQELSYHGEKIKQEDIDEVESLKDCGLIDEIIWFEPTDLHKEDKQVGPRLVETDKRNFILEHLEKNSECSHSIVIDSDEFYDHDDFKEAKRVIDSNEDIKITYCEYINYYRDYKHVLVWPFRCYVPFIAESNYRYDFKKGTFNKPSDPTRRFLLKDDEKSFYIFKFDAIKMHHLSWIRKDISRKIDSWSSRLYFDQVKGLKEAIIDRYKNYKEGLNAIIMFNVPYYQVVVNKLNKQYIHPKYTLDETPQKYKR